MFLADFMAVKGMFGLFVIDFMAVKGLFGLCLTGFMDLFMACLWMILCADL